MASAVEISVAPTAMTILFFRYENMEIPSCTVNCVIYASIERLFGQNVGILLKISSFDLNDVITIQ